MAHLTRTCALSIVAIATLLPVRASAQDAHAAHAIELPMTQAAPSQAASVPDNPNLPAGEEGAKSRLEKSPRHGEYADVPVPGGSPIRAWVVYPERRDKAPVVVVIHEIFGLSDWIRNVADQLARDGFIAIAPDLLTGKGPNGGGTESVSSRDDVVALVRKLTPEEVDARLNAVRAYGIKLPAANGKTATVGFCWGGATSFRYATVQPDLNGAVVYYGSSPDAAALANVKAPVLGLYGGDDARVNATIEPASAEMKKMGKSFEANSVRWRGTWVPARAGGSRRRQSCRRRESLAAHDRIPQTTHQVVRFIGAALALVLGTVPNGTGTVPVGTVPNGTAVALRAISDNSLRADIKFLSSDLLEGRAPSTRGGQLAAEFIASRFAGIGLKPAGENGTYFQPVTIVEAKVDPSAMLSISGGTGAPQSLKYSTDFVAFSGLERSDVSADGDIIFVGYGINAPEQRWNDYAGVDVKGQIVLMMVNDPPAPADEPTLFGGPALTYYGRWTYKYEEAARQGAAGAILMHTTESASYPWQVVQTAWTGTQYLLPVEQGQPMLPLKMWVTDDVAKTLVARAGKDLAQLRTAAATRGFKAVSLGIQGAAQLHQTVSRKQSPNVVGVLPGTRSDQAVVYTAHYDHFGIRDPKPGEPADADRIYNGAVDNASGVAGILAIASAFIQASKAPSRSIYFVATTAEESGLLGAEYFVRHPPLAVDAMAANINVDSLNVLGMTRDLVLLGAERSTLGPMAKAILERQHRIVGIDTAPGAGYFFRSDHFPFAKVGVPALSISEPNEFIGKDPGFAKKQHEDYRARKYHQPIDEYDPSWDLTGAIADLKALAQLGWNVAVAPTMPSYHPQEQFAQPRRTPSSK